jgi:class 3 adenylate cyclase/pimeloyl-ACP methyl ester carboxylesterase
VAVGDADVAYQIVGDGPCDLLCCYGLGSHIDLAWDFSPSQTELFGSFCRTIQFDRRGTGSSDGVPRGGLPTWEEWAEDVGAVLDAAGSARAAIYAEVDAGPIAVLFAATHPDRVSALVLANTFARLTPDDGYPIGVSRKSCDEFIRYVETRWGTEEWIRTIFPTGSDDPEYVRRFARMVRASATPRSAAAQFRYIFERIDVREMLPLVRVPTLVLHNRPNPFIPIALGQYLAEHIDAAKFVEIPSSGNATVAVDSMHRVCDETVEFVTGQRPLVQVDRILTTILFTDIVRSTERLAVLGDQQWRSVLDAHDRAVRERLRRFRGREVKTTGDGFCACFDGPARAIQCARAIIEVAERLGLEVRAGLHTGECEVRGGELSGLAVHVAARVGALASAGELLVTSTVEDLVAGSGIHFTDRGRQSLRGIPEERHLFAVSRT